MRRRTATTIFPKANRPPMAAPGTRVGQAARPQVALRTPARGGASCAPRRRGSPPGGAPTPVLDPGAPGTRHHPQGRILGAPSAASAPTLDFIAAPPTPAPKVDASAAPAVPFADDARSRPRRSRRAPRRRRRERARSRSEYRPHPVTGDIEDLRGFPAGGVAPVLDAVRGALQAALGLAWGGGLRAVRSAAPCMARACVTGRMGSFAARGTERACACGSSRMCAARLARSPEWRPSARLQAQGALAGGGRPKWFLPLVAGAGLLVGIGLFAMLGSLIRGGGGSALARDPGPLAQACRRVRPALLPRRRPHLLSWPPRPYPR